MTEKANYYGDITKKERESVSTSSTSTMAGWTDEQYELLQNYYEDNLGTKMPFPIARLAQQAEAAGMLAETFLAAIDETMFAPKPSPYYLRAVVQRWISAGIREIAQVKADKEQFAARKAETRRTRFSQRDYRKQDWSEFFVKFNDNEI